MKKNYLKNLNTKIELLKSIHLDEHTDDFLMMSTKMDTGKRKI